MCLSQNLRFLEVRLSLWDSVCDSHISACGCESHSRIPACGSVLGSNIPCGPWLVGLSHSSGSESDYNIPACGSNSNIPCGPGLDSHLPLGLNQTITFLWGWCVKLSHFCVRSNSALTITTVFNALTYIHTSLWVCHWFMLVFLEVWLY
jgi:hypothetical protein